MFNKNNEQQKIPVDILLKHYGQASLMVKLLEETVQYQQNAIKDLQDEIAELKKGNELETDE